MLHVSCQKSQVISQYNSFDEYAKVVDSYVDIILENQMVRRFWHIWFVDWIFLQVFLCCLSLQKYSYYYLDRRRKIVKIINRTGSVAFRPSVRFKTVFYSSDPIRSTHYKRSDPSFIFLNAVKPDRTGLFFKNNNNVKLVILGICACVFPSRTWLYVFCFCGKLIITF